MVDGISNNVGYPVSKPNASGVSVGESKSFVSDSSQSKTADVVNVSAKAKELLAAEQSLQNGPGVRPESRTGNVELQNGPGVRPESRAGDVELQNGPGVRPESRSGDVELQNGPGVRPESRTGDVELQNGPGVRP